MTNTPRKVQQWSSIDRYMTDLKMYTRHFSEEFNISIDGISKFAGQDLKEICFAKGKGNPLKFLYFILLHKLSCYSLKEKMHRKFSKVATAGHTSLALINCKKEK